MTMDNSSLNNTYRSIFKPTTFQNKTIIITGGGSGIGRCIAHELASLGAQVLLVGRKEDKLIGVSDEIRSRNGTSAYGVCDIRDEDNVNALVKQFITDYGPIHGLVNNAGGQYAAPLAMIQKKGFEAVVQTNLIGGFIISKAVFTQSMHKHGGAIVNILADMWGGMPGMGHSGAARSGMDNLTKTAAVEWACCGVRVNAVAPGWIASSGMSSYKGPVTAFIPKLKAAVPLKRLGNEAEVSAAVCFLLSPAASFITGATLRVDGAASLGNSIFPLAEHNNSQAYEGMPACLVSTSANEHKALS